MRLPLFIARRYFLSKKSQRVINVISMISMVGVMIGTAALIIVLSVFNGFENLIERLYNSFDADIRITASAGKMFDDKTVNLDAVRSMPGVRIVNPVVEEKALVKYHDKQYIATLKGVGDDFTRASGLDSMLTDGKMLLSSGDTDFAVVGGAIAYNLQMSLSDYLTQLEIYAPRRSASSLSHPEEAFNRRYISPAGIFAVQQEFDAKYIIVPIRFAREIFEYENELSAVEIYTSPGSDVNDIQEKLISLLGKKFEVKNRYQQHELIYKIMKSEKWAVFLILTFIIIIATFNVVSSLTMLVIDKKKDIAVFQSMGANAKMLRTTFLLEGLMITLSGAIIGMLIGFIVCWLQQLYGIIELSGSGSFVIDAYPVKMLVMDFVYVFVAVGLIGLLAAWYPGKRMIREKVNLEFIGNEE